MSRHRGRRQIPRVIDLAAVRRARAGLAELAQQHPELVAPAARLRLRRLLDELAARGGR